MIENENIFGPYLYENEKLQPRQQEIDLFLARTRKDFADEPHETDLVRYRRILAREESFEHRSQTLIDRINPGEIAFFSVFRHTRMFNRELLGAVAHYKYHLHRLASLDFAGPTEFLASADITMKKLNRKKVGDVMRLLRIEEMVEDRKRLLPQLAERWTERSAELHAIVRYVRENLVGIEKLCLRALAVLVDEQPRAALERRQVESIKALFKQELNTALKVRKVTLSDVEKAKQQVRLLARELSDVVRDDLSVLAGVYQLIKDHAHRAVGSIDATLRDLRAVSTADRQQQLLLFRRFEQALVSLVADYPERLDRTGVAFAAVSTPIVGNRRVAVIEQLLEAARKERRARSDRRGQRDRRARTAPNFPGPERRGTKDRRTGARRKKEE